MLLNLQIVLCWFCEYLSLIPLWFTESLRLEKFLPIVHPFLFVEPWDILAILCFLLFSLRSCSHSPSESRFVTMFFDNLTVLWIPKVYLNYSLIKISYFYDISTNVLLDHSWNCILAFANIYRKLSWVRQILQTIYILKSNFMFARVKWRLFYFDCYLQMCRIQYQY